MIINLDEHNNSDTSKMGIPVTPNLRITSLMIKLLPIMNPKPHNIVNLKMESLLL